MLLPLLGDKAQLISPPSARPVIALGCSPDARYVAGATWNPDVATIWDTQAPGRFVHTSLGISTTPSLDRSPRYRAFSEFLHNLSIITMTGFYDRSDALGFKKVKFDHLGGGMLSTPSDFAARVWDPRTGAMTSSFHGRYGANDVSWSRDDALVAMAEPSDLGDEAVSIWDANSGDFTADIPDLHTGAKLVEFSPDGRRLAVVDAEGVIHIYIARTLRPDRRNGRTHTAANIAFTGASRLATVLALAIVAPQHLRARRETSHRMGAFIVRPFGTRKSMDLGANDNKLVGPRSRT